MAMTNEQFKAWLESQNQYQRELVRSINSQRKKTLVDCTARFSGNKDSVESFLATLKLFREIEELSERDVLKGLPLLLTDEASNWWEGEKSSATTYRDFEDKLRQKYAPKTPPYLLYNDLYIKQQTDEKTEDFISKKRNLFALVPAPKHPETQQMDMVYMLLRWEIRDKIPRNSVTTFDQLIESARGVEKVLQEKASEEKGHRKVSSLPKPAEPNHAPRQGKVKCGYCKNNGHTAEVCRKKIRADKAATADKEAGSAGPSTSGPSAPSPKISCYGCGAPGVVRTKCTTCAGKSIKLENVSFCALNVKACIKFRPVLFANIGGINDYAYIDTGAKASVASFALYQKLLERGYTFRTQMVNLSLADGVSKIQPVLISQVDVKLSGRTIPTTFIVLPEARHNKTLLGIGFLESAEMILDLAQRTWRFADDATINELFTEDFVKFDDKPKPRPNDRPHCSKSESAATPISLASFITEEAATVEVEGAATYPKLRRLDPTATKRKVLFDGFSPQSQWNYMLRDAQMNVHLQDIELSPYSRNLFPDPSEIDLDMIDVSLTLNEPLTKLTKKGLSNAPILQQADETKPYIIKTDASGYAYGAVLIQGEGPEEHPVEYASRLLTPAYLTFGRELRTPDEVEHDFKEVVISENFISEIMPKPLQIADTMQKARGVHEMKEEKRKEYVDQRRRESPVYKPGDVVLADVHPLSNASKGHSSKFSPRRDGPYLIKAKHGPSSYKLANTDDPETVVGTYHVSALRPFRSGSEQIPLPTQPLRKRGRPRKAQPSEKKSSQRGRGRPRKN